MNSIGVFPIQNISFEALQARYQKSLKQINKLIEINRQFKQNLTKSEQSFQKITLEISNLQADNSQLQQQNKVLEGKYIQLENHLLQVEEYCKKLQDQLQTCEMQNQGINQQLRERLMKLQEELDNQSAKGMALHQQHQSWQQKHQQNLEIIQQHNKEKNQLLWQVEKLKVEVSRLQLQNANFNSSVREKQLQDLKNKLQKAHNFIKRVMAQNSALKSKQIDNQIAQQRQKVEREIGMKIIVPKMRQGDAVKQLIQQYKKKIRDLEAQKKELNEKYKHLKSKVKAFSLENCQKKIQCLEKLTEKQQKQIARMIQTYDHEFSNIHQDHSQLRNSYSLVLHKLTLKNSELQQKNKCLKQLKLSTECMSFENQSLKKAHESLIQAKESQSKGLSQIKASIESSQSITIQPKSKNQTMEMFYGEKKNNFRCIQSLSMINGFSLNLSNNTARSNV